MRDDPSVAYQELVEEMKDEFPRFRLIPKSESTFQSLIHYALCAITLGQMRTYLVQYHTTLGQRVYLSAGWEMMSDESKYLLLCHERVHMRQFRRYTFPGMTLLYLLLPLPMGLSYFRARFEKEAYAETIRATAAFRGVDAIEDPDFRDYLVRQFTGSSYAWMWPFRASIEAWYDLQIEKARRQSARDSKEPRL